MNGSTNKNFKKHKQENMAMNKIQAVCTAVNIRLQLRPTNYAKSDNILCYVDLCQNTALHELNML